MGFRLFLQWICLIWESPSFIQLSCQAFISCHNIFSCIFLHWVGEGEEFFQRCHCFDYYYFHFHCGMRTEEGRIQGKIPITLTIIAKRKSASERRICHSFQERSTL
jgi:hypothetical protein